jgi:hypothetical protein
MAGYGLGDVLGLVLFGASGRRREVEASGHSLDIMQQRRRLKGLVLSCARLHALQAI